MRAKHRDTLTRVFTKPTPTDIRWADIEALMRALDVEVVERAGSRVLLKKGANRIIVHRPHPRPQIARPAVRQIATFLTLIGVTA